ncbi:MAG: hypothetical protein KAH86_02555 [Methanosarcinales archaeon]|nr:hypothetical protein [Methanosarcinales archaeon]
MPSYDSAARRPPSLLRNSVGQVGFRGVQTASLKYSCYCLFLMNTTRLTITAALLILTILAAGCISTDPVQTKTAAQGNQIDAKETPPKVEVPVEEAEPAPVETHWWDGQSGYTPTTISADNNLFGVELNGVKYQENTIGYQFYDEHQNKIFEQSVYSPESLHLERELQPAQYRQLVEEYGRPSLIIMETIDTDGGGMDKVAVRYEGGKGVLEFETEYKNKYATLVTYLHDYLIK